MEVPARKLLWKTTLLCAVPGLAILVLVFNLRLVQVEMVKAARSAGARVTPASDHSLTFLWLWPLGLLVGLVILSTRLRRKHPGERERRRIQMAAAAQGVLIPTDPDVRHAATRQLNKMVRFHTVCLVFSGVLFVLDMMLAVTLTATFWYFAGLWVLLLVEAAWMKGHLRQRAERLAS